MNSPLSAVFYTFLSDRSAQTSKQTFNYSNGSDIWNVFLRTPSRWFLWVFFNFKKFPRFKRVSLKSHCGQKKEVRAEKLTHIVLHNGALNERAKRVRCFGIEDFFSTMMKLGISELVRNEYTSRHRCIVFHPGKK